MTTRKRTDKVDLTGEKPTQNAPKKPVKWFLVCEALCCGRFGILKQGDEVPAEVINDWLISEGFVRSE